MSEEYNNGGPPLKHIIPFWEKATMTLDEASEYSGIGRNTLYRLTNQNNCPFVLRQVPLMDFAKDALEQEKLYQEGVGLSCNITIDDYTDFVFLNKNGSVHNESSLNRALKRIIRDCNTEEFEKSEMPPVLLPNFSCHTLRHTFTTRMVEAGINIKVIQDALGHSDISTTMNIYADATKELKKSEFEGLESIFR